MMKKHVLPIVLALLFMLALLPASAFADTTVITTFGKKTVLTYTQYDLLRTGSISAVKKSGVWYYQFSKNGNKLLVKTTAFSEGVGNDFTPVNNALTKGVMRTDGIAQKYSYAFKARTSTTSKTVPAYSSSSLLYQRTTQKTYVIYISWLTTVANRVGTEIDLDCKKNGHVQFTYTDKIKMDYALRNGYKAPSTATEFQLALRRNTTNGVTTKMIPTFELAVTKPGTNCVRLNSCLYRGKGIADTKTPITDYIDVALAAGEVVKDLATGSLPFKNLFKLYAQASGKLVKKSGEYTSNQKTYLSWNNSFSMKAKFRSPVSLKVCDDYFRAEVRLSKAPSCSGTKTQMQVVFSVTHK